MNEDREVGTDSSLITNIECAIRKSGMLRRRYNKERSPALSFSRKMLEIHENVETEVSSALSNFTVAITWR